MPGKKKKQSSRPIMIPQDSMRRDIEAARASHVNHVTPNESGTGDESEDLDLADQLLATLNARDEAAAKTASAKQAEERALSPKSPKKVTSGTSEENGHGSSSPNSHRRGPGEILLHAGEKFFGGHHSHHHHHHHSSKSPPLISSPDNSETNEGLQGHMGRNGSIRSRIFGSSPNKLEVEEEKDETQKLSRQKARKERKAAEAAAQRLEVELELKANGIQPDLAEKERVAITELCRSLNVEMKEITPDGHCLYAAIADQLNLHHKGGHSKLNYHDTRKATSQYMKTHADDFMPFISDSDEHMAGIENLEAGSSDVSKQEGHFLQYCDAVESTGVWGGEPEILALSRAFMTPIHVVQAGRPVVKIEPEESKGTPLMISYHRRMYGLGEHYNSLHPISKSSEQC
ncbi:hypothetical protein CBS101457_003840 [Exobasidium rhododendri]|nr:hypothetical protein CBS101457_003840 [Exobasidium rhododendri]